MSQIPLNQNQISVGFKLGMSEKASVTFRFWTKFIVRNLKNDDVSSLESDYQNHTVTVQNAF